MEKFQNQLRLATIVLFCLLTIGFGIYAVKVPMMVGGALGMVYAASAMTAGIFQATAPAFIPARIAMPIAVATQPADPANVDGLVDRMISQSRYALLLRSQVAGNLGEQHRRRAHEKLHETMALVPDGDVVLRDGFGDPLDGTSIGRRGPGSLERRVNVASLFLDRYAVTNRQYYDFVAAGGYREMSLWDSRLWSAALEMVDQTGLPGPRFWVNGCYAPGEEDLPVVGVSWYEAQACTRWMGKRLPGDAEWVKAACWPVPTDSEALVERRYPWGDTMDRGRANVWGSGPNRAVAVDEFAGGASVGGVYQMIGNVWEWTSSDFHLFQSAGGGEAAPLKSIRGGAFDTYFDNQATCQFESGEYPLSRRHNIGFRCAIGACDLVLAVPQGDAESTADAARAELEEACV